jgi:hypothetical protein
MVIVSTFNHDRTTVLFVTTGAAISFGRRFPWPLGIVNTFVHDGTNSSLIKTSRETILERTLYVRKREFLTYGDSEHF